MTNWEILDSDGRYIARRWAIRPEAAFCEHMYVTGTVVTASEIAIESRPDGAHLITHQGRKYILNSTETQRPYA